MNIGQTKRFHDFLNNIFFSSNFAGNGSFDIGTSSAGQLGRDPSGSANYHSHIIIRHLFSQFFLKYVIFFSNKFAGNGSVNIGTSSAGQLGRDPSGSANYRSHIISCATCFHEFFSICNRFFK